MLVAILITRPRQLASRIPHELKCYSSAIILQLHQLDIYKHCMDKKTKDLGQDYM